MTEDVKPEVEELEGPPEPPPGPNWGYKTEFAINGRMRDLIQKSISAAEQERDALLRKLERLTYGS